MIICAGDIESFEFATPIGIGLVNSAINLTRLILLNPPKYILFIGSCGSYGEHKILDLIASSGASNIELSFWQNQSYSPLDNVLVQENSIVSHETIINSSNYITTTPLFNDNFIKNNISAENMEFFSVMAIAKEFNINAGGIFVVTNYCNENAHNDFLSNHKLAMEKISNYVKLNILPKI